MINLRSAMAGPNREYQAMQNYVLSIIHPVTDTAAASGLLTEHLGFRLYDSGPGYHVVDNGSVAIRLLEDAERAGTTLHLDVRSVSLTDDKERFLALEGVSLHTAVHFPHTHRAECTLAAPHGIFITLARAYSEDDLGELPELGRNMPWDEDAELVVKQLLRMVPIDFREPARKRTVQTAEEFAAASGAPQVDLNTGVRALLKISPKFQRPHIISWLRAENIPADAFEQEFPAE